jgi:hypothetical protein
VVFRRCHVTTQAFGCDALRAEPCRGSHAFFQVARTGHDEDAKLAESAGRLQSEAAIAPVMNAIFFSVGHPFEFVLATLIQLPCQRFDNAKVPDRKQIAKLCLRSRPERKIGRTKNRPLLVVRLVRSEERVYPSSQRWSKLEDLSFLINSADGTRPTVGIRGHGRR